MKISNICPICGEGHLKSKEVQLEREHNGIKGIVAFNLSECNECGCEISTEEQVMQNKRNMISFRKKCDGYTSGDEIKKFRSYYKITQKQAAKIFGGGVSAFSKYENDEICQSEAMDKLLKVAIAVPEAMHYLSSISNIKVSYLSQEKSHINELYKSLVIKFLDVKEVKKDSVPESRFTKPSMHKPLYTQENEGKFKDRKVHSHIFSSANIGFREASI